MKSFFFFILIIHVIVSMDALDLLESYKREIVKTNQIFEVAVNMNDIHVGDKVITNGLEHVIKKLVFEDKHDLDIMNHMLVRPETPYFTQQSFLKEFIELHQTLQKEIINELKIAAPFVPNSDLKKLFIDDLGIARRSLTGRALLNIVREIIDPNLKKHRGNITELLRSFKQTRITEFDFRKKCQFIALYVSSKYPTDKLKAVGDLRYRTCEIFKGEKLLQTVVVREIKGVWWEVKCDNFDEKVRRFKCF